LESLPEELRSCTAIEINRWAAGEEGVSQPNEAALPAQFAGSKMQTSLEHFNADGIRSETEDVDVIDG
jgi:hypothetical protein